MCLKDYIGFKWCKAEEPDSGLWINTLPGISLRSIDNLANEEQLTFLGVWNDVQDRAITKLNTFVQNHFAKRYKLNTVIDSVALGRVIDTVNNQTAAAVQYRGITLDLGECSSPLSRIYVQSISIYSPAAEVAVDIKIFEVLNNDLANEVYTATKDFEVGWNTILINKTFEVQKIFIAYDATSINSVYQSVDGNYPWDCGDCGACITIGDCKAYIRGAVSDKPFGNLLQHNNTFGLSGVFGVQCSFDALVCYNKNVFKTALWYLLGSEAMFERMYSDRLNRYTTVDRKLAEELYQQYSSAADNELMNAIEGIQLDCDFCISADAPVTVITNLP